MHRLFASLPQAEVHLPRSRRFAGILAGLALLAQSGTAFGYCRATSCAGDEDDYCAIGDNGCVIDGMPLGWPAASTVHFSMDEDSADDAGIDDAQKSLEDAVGAWADVRCDGEPADISVGITTASDSDDADAVITIEFVSQSWDYEDNAVGRTIIEFDAETGWMSGAAIYLNSEQYVLREDPRDLEVDLTSVLVHEIGHVLALAHTPVDGATMQSEADSAWAGELRTLEADDEDGLCALYPPDADTVIFDLGEGGNSVMPADGDEMSGGGCSQSTARPSASGWLSVGLLLAGGLGLRAARRRARVVSL